jgi:cytochrome c oxidase assembly protein subunit 11
MDSKPAKPDHSRHARVAIACVAVVAAMTGLAFASVPFYQMFCRVTGYGGTTQRVETAGTAISDREVTVRFDSNISAGLDWKFYPAQRSIKVKYGEVAKIYYYAENLGKQTRTGSATFNVTPEQSGAYFNKIQCFCFTETVVKPGEKLEMPVVFYVDPAFIETEEGRDINTITLSYTFFGVDKADKPLALQEQKNSGAAGG